MRGAARGASFGFAFIAPDCHGRAAAARRGSLHCFEAGIPSIRHELAAGTDSQLAFTRRLVGHPYQPESLTKGIAINSQDPVESQGLYVGIYPADWRGLS